MSTSFTVALSFYDSRNNRYLYFKPDGKRFGDDKTIKISSDQKYDVTVTIKPANLELEKLVVGSDDMTPDRSDQRDEKKEYKFSWFTNGYPPTKKGVRNDVRVSCKFSNGELAFKLQAKFYPLADSSHLTWGTPLKMIEVESRGDLSSLQQHFPPNRVTFK